MILYSLSSHTNVWNNPVSTGVPWVNLSFVLVSDSLNARCDTRSESNIHLCSLVLIPHQWLQVLVTTVYSLHCWSHTLFDISMIYCALWVHFIICFIKTCIDVWNTFNVSKPVFPLDKCGDAQLQIQDGRSNLHTTSTSGSAPGVPRPHTHLNSDFNHNPNRTWCGHISAKRGSSLVYESSGNVAILRFMPGRVNKHYQKGFKLMWMSVSYGGKRKMNLFTGHYR